MNLFDKILASKTPKDIICAMPAVIEIMLIKIKVNPNELINVLINLMMGEIVCI